MQQVSPMATRYDGPTIWFHWAVCESVDIFERKPNGNLTGSVNAWFERN